MKRLLIAICLGLCGAGMAHAAEPAQTGGQGQNLLFILDASGSMWGRIEGKPKISVAKDVMSRLVKNLPADSKAGLIAYGHRRKGDCNDIQTLIPLAPLARQQMIGKLRALNPKGKTPLAAAVKQAVEQLRQVEETATIVLVSDGLESCNADPCDAVSAAKKAGIDFKLDVVGLGLKKTDTKQLRCMAKAGGGRYFAADNTEQLSSALKKATRIRPILELTVTGNGKPVPAQVVILKAGTQHRIAKSEVGTQPDGSPANPRRITLAAGEYDVQVTPSGMQGVKPKTLEDVTLPKKGAVKRTVDFSAGTLSVRVTANGKPQPAGIHIYPAGGDEWITAFDVSDGANPNSRKFPPGDYDIKVHARHIQAPDQWLRGVQLAAGETTEQSVDFSAGTLSVRVTGNGKPIEAGIGIYPAGGNDRITAFDVSDSTNPNSRKFPPGDYDIKVHARHMDTPEQWLRGVHVTAGETMEKTVDFKATDSQ